MKSWFQDNALETYSTHNEVKSAAENWLQKDLLEP